MHNALKFRQTDVPRQAGEKARLKVLQGPDYGSVYVVIGARALIGRGEECDVLLSDLKSSRRHAAIELVGGKWRVQDAGSANGLLHNGQNVKQGELKFHDTLSFGETTLEFISSADAHTQMLVAPPRPIDQVVQQQAALSAQKKRVGSLATGGGGKASGRALNPKVLLLVGAAVAGVVFFGGDSSPKPARAPSSAGNAGAARDLASMLPPDDPAMATVKRDAEAFFRIGYREYANGNYLRARASFETVLQVYPTHALARIYLENCTQKVDYEVKYNLEMGKRNFDSGKLRSARGHFEAVLRLLYRDHTSPSYIEADDQLNKVNQTMREDHSG